MCVNFIFAKLQFAIVWSSISVCVLRVKKIWLTTALQLPVITGWLTSRRVAIKRK